MGDIDTVVDLHAEDAVIISRGHVRRGHEGVRAHYEEVGEMMNDSELEMDVFQEYIEGEFVMFTYAMRASDFHWDFAVDTMVIQDGKITGHTVAVYEHDG